MTRYFFQCYTNNFCRLYGRTLSKAFKKSLKVLSERGPRASVGQRTRGCAFSMETTLPSPPAPALLPPVTP